jgi:glutathione S-transferase
MITIYNFARGVRGLRACWQCEEMGLPYRVEAVSFPPSPEYRAKHALGTVPFLEDEGGVAISESVAMMLYLAHRYGPTPLLPSGGGPRAALVLERTVFGEATLGAGINPLLLAHFGAPEADKRSWLVGAQERRIEQALGQVCKWLGAEPFLAGDQFSLADISVSCALGMWLGALGKPLPEPLVAYRARLAERPTYQRAREKTQAAQQPAE